MAPTKEECRHIRGTLVLLQNELAPSNLLAHSVLDAIARFLMRAERRLPSQAAVDRDRLRHAPRSASASADASPRRHTSRSRRPKS